MPAWPSVLVNRLTIWSNRIRSRRHFNSDASREKIAESFDHGASRGLQQPPSWSLRPTWAAASTIFILTLSVRFSCAILIMDPYIVCSSRHRDLDAAHSLQQLPSWSGRSTWYEAAAILWRGETVSRLSSVFLPPHLADFSQGNIINPANLATTLHNIPFINQAQPCINPKLIPSSIMLRHLHAL